MNANNTITITLQVTREGDKFGAGGWTPRTRDEWAQAGATWGEGPGRDVARAMVEYIDSLPVDEPKGCGFLGTLLADGEEYDVTRTKEGVFYAASRVDGGYFTFPSGLHWTPDWSKVLAAGTFTPRKDTA